jgi:hypothetical protein
MTTAVAGSVGWLLMLTVAMRLARAAKRGDELAQAARRYLPASQTGAAIIPIDRTRGAEPLT